MSSDFTARADANGVCYRHANRQSFVLCQRCGRTICGECQTPAAVGVICPECMREQRAQQSPAQKRAGAWTRRMSSSGAPTVTTTLIGVTAFVYLLQWLIPPLTGYLMYAGYYSYPMEFEPWRMVTSVFAHSKGFLFHIALNMYTLWIFGRILEQMLGRGRFLTLYLISGVAGSLGVMFLSDPMVGAVGASGAIFGLMGALIVIERRVGGNMRSLMVLVAINLVIGFIPGFNIAWQAHLGGLIGGAIVGLIYYENRRVEHSRRLWIQLGLLCAVMILAACSRLILG